MAEGKLTKLELQIMEMLWTQGQVSIREIQEAFPEKGRPAYTTIQTMVYRLEDKKACAPGQEGRQLPHFRSGCIPRCRAAEVD